MIGLMILTLQNFPSRGSCIVGWGKLQEQPIIEREELQPKSLKNSCWMRSIRIDDTSGVTKIELKRESGPVITKKWQKAQYRNTSDLQDKMFPKNGKISNFANGHEKNQSAYIYYFERHKLERCDRFMKKTLNKRNLFLPNQNYCYKCLKAMKEGRNLLYM